MASECSSKIRSHSSLQLNSKQTRNTNILKFINENNSQKRVQGKKCRPQQMFGYGQQSPDNFKTNYSLKAENSYIFRFDDHPQNHKCEYFSQKHFIDLGKEGLKQPEIKNNTEFMNKFQEASSKNKLAFHRRKGRLSQFMDKNGWMAKTHNLMGFQRCQTARQCCNRDRSRNIQKKDEEMKKKQKAMSIPVKSKKYFGNSHSKFGQILLTQKVKTRQLRNFFATLQITGNPQEIRPNTTMGLRSDSQNIQNKQKSKQFRLTNQKYNFQKTAQLWNKEDSNRIKAMGWTKPQKIDEWLQTTCGSKFSNTQSMLGNRKVSLKY